MKKFLLPALILVAGAFAACNNGPYDATPDTDLSGIQNPINPDLTAAKGTFKARINGGQFVTFDSARFQLFNDSNYFMSAGRASLNPVSFQGIFLRLNAKLRAATFPIVDTLAPGTTFPNVSGGYATQQSFTDTTGLQIWDTDFDRKMGTGEIKVDFFNADEIKGTFRFTAYRYYPEDTGSRVNVTEGSFWVTKQQ